MNKILMGCTFLNVLYVTQQINTCLKLTIETREKDVKYVQS